MQWRFDPWVAGGLVSVLAALIAAAWRNPSQIRTTHAGAVAALAQLQEWAKWMAAIETAALGATSLLVYTKDFGHVRALGDAQAFLASSAYACLAAGLFSSAWILGSIPSLTIRVHGLQSKLKRCSRRDIDVTSTSFDVYEEPLFAWSGAVRLPGGRTVALKLGYVLSANHWLWGVGLGALGLIVLTQLRGS